jgi:SAM-dependent methyltransferase
MMAPAALRTRDTGGVFTDADVVRAYRHRPPYPPELPARLAALAAGRARAVDLGSGPGKIAIPLADHFSEVLAVDSSPPMIAQGRVDDAGRHANIRWIERAAEHLPLPACDLAVAAASVHWLDPAIVFPALKTVLGANGVLAIVDGDSPFEASFEAGYMALITSWVERLGDVAEGAKVRAHVTAHEAWLDVHGHETLRGFHRQSVGAFIESEHSRAAWARSRMGEARAAEFDADLRRLLTPHARLGFLEFTVQTTLTWGRPRARPR